MVVFYVMEHSLFASVEVAQFGLALAADKAAAVADGSISRRLAYVAFAAYGAIDWRRPAKFDLAPRGVLGAMVLGYLGLAVSSLAWSVSPMLSLRRLTALGLLAIGVTGMLRRFSGPAIVKLIALMALGYLLIGVGAELALGMFTPWAGGYRFAGTLHPNIQGTNCAALVLSAATLAGLRQRSRRLFVAIACFGFGFLLLTGSRTALAGCIASLIAFWLLSTRSSTTVTVLSGVACLLLVDLFLVANGVVASPLRFLFQ